MGSFSIWHWMVLLFIFFVVFSPVIIGIMVMGIQRRVLMKHEPSGLLKKGFFGYSWTYLLFGFLSRSSGAK